MYKVKKQKKNIHSLSCTKHIYIQKLFLSYYIKKKRFWTELCKKTLIALNINLPSVEGSFSFYLHLGTWDIYLKWPLLPSRLKFRCIIKTKQETFRVRLYTSYTPKNSLQKYITSYYNTKHSEIKDFLFILH